MKKSIGVVLAISLLFLMMLFASATGDGTTLSPLASVTSVGGSFQTIDIGDKVFANRTYVFTENMPS